MSSPKGGKNRSRAQMKPLRGDTGGGVGDLSGEDDEERRREHRLLVDVERGVCIAELEEEDFEKVIGSAWRITRVKRLDFSEPRYQLEHLDGLVHLDKGRLNRLSYMDVSNNRLHSLDYICNANGFDNLAILLARRNSILRADLQLKRLLELNLANNMLTEPPDLSLMPVLEVLVLSSNRLSGSFQPFRKGARLKYLDLSHNLYDCCPSALARGLDYLSSGAKNLTNLRIYANPFVACFPEYQIFIVKELPTLQKIDDLRISRTLRNSITATRLHALEVYDTEYQQRLNKFRERQEDATLRATNAERGFARLTKIIGELECIFDDPISLQKHVTNIHAQAKALTDQLRRSGSVKDREHIEDLFWTQVPQIDGSCIAAGNRTLELITTIMERHESVRQPLIETLGHLTAVSRYELGPRSMEAIGKTMLGDDLSKNQAADILGRVVLANLKDFCLSDLSSAYSRALVGGINAMLRNSSIKEKVSDALKDFVVLLVDCVVRVDSIVDIPYGIKLLSNLTETQENAQEAATEGLCKRCLAAIDNKSIAEAGNLRSLYIDVLKLSMHIVQHGPDYVLDMFTTFSTHVQVISRGKAIYDGGRFHNNPVEAATLASILNFVTALMARRDTVMKDCCGSFHIVALLCQILNQQAIDPLLLSSACDCLKIILQDDKMYERYAEEVSDKLNELVPLLDFLDGQRYRDLYKQALRHAADDQLLKEINNDEVIVPALTHLSNELVINAFLAVISLLALFVRGSTGSEDDPIRKQVQVALGQNESEAKLLSLLLMPNDEIKLHVMHCIVDMPLTQIQPKEMGMIIKTISNTRNIGEGEAEQVLALLIQMLGRLVQDSGEAGHEFRQTYAHIAIAEVYQTLCRNSRRATHGNAEEEQQKLKLSREIVNYFRACSRSPGLRGQMRKAEILREFPEILKLEEELHSPWEQDVPIEQSWVGRSLSTLLSCLIGPRALDANRKVFIRLLGRIAVVLEGRSDSHQKQEAHSIEEVCAMERLMWADRTAVARLQSGMDEQEKREWKDEAETFVDMDGIRVILEMLLEVNSHNGGSSKNSGSAAAIGNGNGNNSSNNNKSSISNGGGAAAAAAALTNGASGGSGGGQAQGMADGGGGIGGRSRSDSVRESRLLRLGDAPREGDQDSAGLKGQAALTVAALVDEEVHGGGPLFPSKPSLFNTTDEIFANRAEGRMQPWFAIALLLRIMHALILAPPSDGIRKKIIRQMRQPGVLHKLISLVERQPCLACNIAAKLMLLMHTLYLDVVQFGIQLEQSPPRYENLRLMAGYISQHAVAMTSLIDMTEERQLAMEEQTLGREMCRCLSTLILGTMLSTGEDVGSDLSPRGQDHHEDWAASGKKIEDLVDPASIQVAIAFILYEIQMDMGGGSRRTINKELAKPVRQKGLKDMASHLLIRLLTWCSEDLRYRILEQFSQAEVFHFQTVRTCYLMELLFNTNLGKYLIDIGPKTLHLAGSQLAFYEPVYCLNAATSTVSVMLLCGTASKLWLLLPPSTGGPLGKDHNEKHFHRCSIELETHPNQIRSIYRGYGKQLLGFQWCNGSSTLLAFLRRNARDSIAHFLHRASGDQPELRANMFTDPSTQAAVEEVVTGTVLAASVTTNPVASLIEGRTVETVFGLEGIPRLCVLTSTEVYEFSLDFVAWTAADTAAPYFDESEGARRSVQGGQLGDGSPSKQSATSLSKADAKDKPKSGSRPRFACTLPGFYSGKNASAQEGTEAPLTLLKSCPLPPQKVEFDVGLHPDLSIQGSQSIEIRFCTDGAREEWRRVLADICSGWQRNGEDAK